MDDLGQQKEPFRRADVQAIAAVGGFSTYQHAVDEDSVDLGIGMRQSNSPRLEIQLKCTAAAKWRGDLLCFPLKAKNYEDLRGDRFMVPRLLVVVEVPPKPERWLAQGEGQLILRASAYWLSLRKLGPAREKTKLTVQLPRQQRFTVESLCAIVEALSEGLAP
ncbi:MAG: DUF4365 domain-containing protein [Bryobacterales bacterium]|nr:DUF4365 domain-containing protein [Bryobacterales bacterium]